MIISEEKQWYRGPLERYNVCWPLELRNRQSRSPEPTSGARVLLGNWRGHLPGEAEWIIYTRGVIASIFIVGVASFGLFNIVIQPVRNLDQNLVRELRTTKVDALPEHPGSSIYVVLVHYVRNYYDQPLVTPDEFAAAVNITLLDPPSNGANLSAHSVNVTRSPCFYDNAAVDELARKELNAVGFRCDTGKRLEDDRDQALIKGIQNYIFPDILVTVNFTQIKYFDSYEDYYLYPNLQKAKGFSTVQAYVGFRPANLILTTSSEATLIPGVNLIGQANVFVKKIVKSTFLSVLGLFDLYNTVFATEITHLWPDPFRSAQNEETASDIKVGSLRIHFHLNFPWQWKIVQDDRNASVFDGFASVGGLSAFLAGIFAAVFGTSIMKILFAIKPLSIYGLAHWFHMPTLMDACVSEYPRIYHDLSGSPEARGLLSFIHDQLLDVDLSKTRKPDAQANIETVSSSHLHTNTQC
ncbi:hypothetical protein CPB83DRAFT_894874 [Crepidotus variabilis]|uniref:Uncharacterized protein n=1 Tax=Crepidotus variabilis TaxID=179855 RepID=A0A9P6EEC4_9AGAR|nr:hypothetical protein CPB83DRAFT_894874 [Crepidotus variabilis]